MNKINVYEHEKAKNLKLKDRKYILRHSDDTGGLFLQIVDNFDDFEFSEDKDEVFGYWEEDYFVFKCELDNEDSSYTTYGRYLIFKGHIENSLLVMMKYERKLKMSYMNILVKEIYYSEDKEYNRVIIEKTLYDFLIEDGKFIKYKSGFDYKSLKKYKKLP